MPRVFSEDTDPKEIKDAKKTACSELREDFKLCMLNTDCVKLHKKSAKECFEIDEGKKRLLTISAAPTRLLLFLSDRRKTGYGQRLVQVCDPLQKD